MGWPPPIKKELQIGRAIMYFRRKAGLSQDEMSKRMGLDSHTSLCRLERNRSYPTIPNLIAICTVLEIYMSTLIKKAEDLDYE